jgi:UrcA family protein
MTSLLKTICVAACVSTAALAATGAASSLQAAEDPVRIQAGDLNLNTPQGRAAFNVRVDRAARQMCEERRDLILNAECQRDVRQEAMDTVTALARHEDANLESERR